MPVVRKHLLSQHKNESGLCKTPEGFATKNVFCCALQKWQNANFVVPGEFGSETATQKTIDKNSKVDTMETARGAFCNGTIMRPLSRCAPRLACAVPAFFVLCLYSVSADEPNNTFAQSTVLDTGTLSVTDDLSPGTGTAPNTYLGVFDEFGFDWFDNLIDDNDDGSTLGNEEASGLIDIGVNPDGSIRFIVTGTGDLDFDGTHEETGGYKAFVEVFDAGNNPVDDFTVNGTLQPDVADEYTFSDSNWLGGNFSINLDNTVDGFTGGDVDFFTFTGLNAGATFSAETSSVGAIDTMLGWYNDAGTLIAQDDDSGTGVWSLLAGTVPASGKLTFAVTGNGDDMFLGEHAQQEVFDLQLTIEGANLPADFDGDGDVDGADLSHPTLGWEARYGNDLDGADFLLWQRVLSGVSGSVAALQSVPEPTSYVLCLTLLGYYLTIRRPCDA